MYLGFITRSRPRMPLNRRRTRAWSCAYRDDGTHPLPVKYYPEVCKFGKGWNVRARRHNAASHHLSHGWRRHLRARPQHWYLPQQTLDRRYSATIPAGVHLTRWDAVATMRSSVCATTWQQPDGPRLQQRRVERLVQGKAATVGLHIHRQSKRRPPRSR